MTESLIPITTPVHDQPAEHAHIMVCQSCLFTHANGVDEQLQEGDPEPWGLLPTADVSMDYDAETGEGVDDFSTAQCPACGQYLAGERYRMAVWTWGEDYR